MSGALKKPVLRGLLHKQIVTSVSAALVISAACGLAFKTFIGDRRKRVYAEFYKNYDIEKEFEEMRKKGVFDSCK